MSDVTFHAFDATGVASLRLALRSADVSISTWGSDRVEVEVEVRRGDRPASELVTVAARALGSDRTLVTIEEPRRRSGFSRDPGISIRVRAPHGANVECTSGSSDLEIDGELGDLVVKTASGDVSVGHVRRLVKANGAGGDVSIASAGGAVTVNTASGDVSIGSAAGHVSVNCVSGDVDVRVVNDGLSVTTVSGDLEVGALVAGNAKIQSVSGDIELGVAHGTAVWIDAQSVSGDIGSTLELEDAPEQGQGVVSELRVRTVSGDVQIVRAAVVTPSG